VENKGGGGRTRKVKVTDAGNNDTKIENADGAILWVLGKGPKENEIGTEATEKPTAALCAVGFNLVRKH